MREYIALVRGGDATEPRSMEFRTDEEQVVRAAKHAAAERFGWAEDTVQVMDLRPITSTTDDDEDGFSFVD
jgi:hypothetical protein